MGGGILPLRSSGKSPPKDAAAAVVGESPQTEDSGDDSLNNVSTGQNNQNDHESEDTNQAESDRRLFIGGVSWSLNNDKLTDIFKEFGEIVSCRIPEYPGVGHHRGFAYILYKTRESAIKAMKAMHQTHVDQRLISVKWAEFSSNGSKPSTTPPKYNASYPSAVMKEGYWIEIKGLPRECIWMDIKDFCRGAQLHAEYTNIRSDGVGVAKFLSEKEANIAVLKLNNRPFMGDGPIVSVSNTSYKSAYHGGYKYDPSSAAKHDPYRIETGGVAPNIARRDPKIYPGLHGGTLKKDEETRPDARPYPGLHEGAKRIIERSDRREPPSRVKRNVHDNDSPPPPPREARLREREDFRGDHFAINRDISPHARDYYLMMQRRVHSNSINDDYSPREGSNLSRDNRGHEYDKRKFGKESSLGIRPPLQKDPPYRDPRDSRDGVYRRVADPRSAARQSPIDSRDEYRQREGVEHVRHQREIAEGSRMGREPPLLRDSHQHRDTRSLRQHDERVDRPEILRNGRDSRDAVYTGYEADPGLLIDDPRIIRDRAQAALRDYRALEEVSMKRQLDHLRHAYEELARKVQDDLPRQSRGTHLTEDFEREPRYREERYREERNEAPPYQNHGPRSTSLHREPMRRNEFEYSKGDPASKRRRQ